MVDTWYVSEIKTWYAFDNFYSTGPTAGDSEQEARDKLSALIDKTHLEQKIAEKVEELRDQCFPGETVEVVTAAITLAWRLVSSKTPNGVTFTIPGRLDKPGQSVCINVRYVDGETPAQSLAKLRRVLVGKNKAGRSLDGREWNELPEQVTT